MRALREEGGSEEEVEKATGRVREVYERAIANFPPGDEKRHWRRYIFLWLYYAVFEECEAQVCATIGDSGSVLALITLQDYGRALDIYKLAISNVPHKKFTFAKLWLQFARFHIRRQDLKDARQVLGTSIGMCPKEKLFTGYIDLELEVCRFTRTMQPALMTSLLLAQGV